MKVGSGFLILISFLLGQPAARAAGLTSLTAPMMSTAVPNALPVFQPVDALSRAARSRLTPVLDATFHFRLDNGVDCTGTFISKSGHFITARHCVASCLLQNHVVEREVAIDDPTATVTVGYRRDGTALTRDAYTYKMTVEDDRVNDGIDCPGRLGSQASNFKIVFTGGRGWLTPTNTLASFSQKYPQDYEDLLGAGYEHSGDFAIMQVREKESTVSRRPLTNKCLSLSRLGPLRGQALQAVSYPCMERGALAVHGTTALYTNGVKTAGFKESAYYRRLGEDHVPFKVSTVERKETFFSTLDMERCGSGTAVLASDYSIVGIATRVYKSSVNYESGSLEAIDSAAIIHELRSRAPASWREMTDCR